MATSALFLGLNQWTKQWIWWNIKLLTVNCKSIPKSSPKVMNQTTPMGWWGSFGDSFIVTLLKMPLYRSRILYFIPHNLLLIGQYSSVIHSPWFCLLTASFRYKLQFILLNDEGRINHLLVSDTSYMVHSPLWPMMKNEFSWKLFERSYWQGSVC